MLRIFLCFLMLLFCPLHLQGCFEGIEDNEENSEKNNSGLTPVDSDPSSAAAAQEGDNNACSDNESAESSNSRRDLDPSLNTPPTHKKSSPRALRAIADLAQKIRFAQQDVHDLKIQRREIQEEIERGFEVSFDERKNIGIQVRDTCEKWNRERQIYHLSQREVQDKIDREIEGRIHELFALMDSIFAESEQTLLLIFPEKRVRDLFIVQKENSDASSLSSRRAPSSPTLVQNEKSDFSSATELESSYSYNFPYTEFFETKAELICLQREIEKKEHLHREAISRLTAEKAERDSAVKNFRKKHRFQLCSSSYPIIQDYQPRIETAERNVVEQERGVRELHEIMGIQAQNVSYFADTIRKEIPQKFELWKYSRDESNLREDFTIFLNKKLRNMRDCFLKKDSRLSATDREKIGWEELFLEK